MCLYFELLSTLLTYKLHWNYLISHAKTSLFDDCAGGSQGVQLLDWSNTGQVRAIRLMQVWDSWHPSIQSWSLWIGKSTCLCEPTFQKLNLPPPKELYTPSLQALKTLFGPKLQAGSLVRVWRMQLCLKISKNYQVAECPLVLRIRGLAVHLTYNHPCSLTSPRKLTKLPPQTDWWWTTKPPRQKAFQIL